MGVQFGLIFKEILAWYIYLCVFYSGHSFFVYSEKNACGMFQGNELNWFRPHGSSLMINCLHKFNLA